MNTESGIPVTGLYADEAPSGYIEPPTNTQFHSGVEPEMTLPAAWWNYFVNLFTNTNIKTKEDITAILAELNNALTTMGITPDPEASNQLATLFQNDVLPVTFADASMNANPYTTSSLVPKHRGNIAINTTTRTTWIATNTTAAAASWSRLWSPENDGTGSGLDADKVRSTTPGARGLQYLSAAAVSNIAALILADLKTVDGTGSGLDADIVRGTTPGTRGLQYLSAAAVSNIAALILSDLKTVDGTGTGLDTDLVRGTTPGTRGLNYLAAGTVATIAALLLADIKTVDGKGSGLDADLLDGLSSYDFSRRFVFSGVENSVDLDNLLESGFYHATDYAHETTTFINTPLGVVSGGFGLYIVRVGSNYCYQVYKPYGFHSAMYMRSSSYNGSLVWSAWSQMWNAGNDGSGSGLDADLLDGLQGDAYAKVNTATSSTATDLPVGSYILMTGDGVTRTRNQVYNVYYSEGSDYAYFNVGTILSGTWRASGAAKNITDRQYYTLMRRVA